MADFCNNCANRMGFPRPDLDVAEIFESITDDYHYQSVICEGCGLIAVARMGGELKVMYGEAGKHGVTSGWTDYIIE